MTGITSQTLRAIECHIDRVHSADQKERIAVWRGPHDGFGGDVCTPTRPVLDDEWPAETLREPLTYQARRDVEPTAGSSADDDAHRPRRIHLRPCHVWSDRQRGSARGQMQKLMTGKFHRVPLVKFWCWRQITRP